MKKSLLLLVVAIFTLTTAFEASAKWTDRNTFNLKGPVKAVQDKNNGNLYFEEDGTYILSEDWEEVSRDEYGRIESVGADMQGTYYTYNNKKQVKSTSSLAGNSYSSETSYFYNTKGQIIKTIETTANHSVLGDEYNWHEKTTTTYTYQKFDKYGNWIKRTAKTGKKRTVETRTITYY
ncbi:MAG: hypothetical protein IKJ52_11870 [Muribaculaceae bacterium]|nr:hypothetical protein [Muribaculaceae bacterium]